MQAPADGPQMRAPADGLQIQVAADAPRIDVRRSRRRTRTVSAYRDKDAIVVLLPARLSAAEEEAWVATLVERVLRSERRRRPSDDELALRASRLSRQYLDDLAHPVSVQWVDNQNSRWGSCTPADKTIRVSTRVRGMPAYVIDYVVLHELTHLIVPGHGSDFWAWVARYPSSERARGFLEGVSAATHQGPEGDDRGTPGASSCPELEPPRDRGA